MRRSGGARSSFCGDGDPLAMRPQTENVCLHQHPVPPQPSEALQDVALFHCLVQIAPGVAPQPFKGVEKPGSAQSMQSPVDGGELGSVLTRTAIATKGPQLSWWQDLVLCPKLVTFYLLAFFPTLNTQLEGIKPSITSSSRSQSQA